MDDLIIDGMGDVAAFVAAVLDGRRPRGWDELLQVDSDPTGATADLILHFASGAVRCHFSPDNTPRQQYDDGD